MKLNLRRRQGPPREPLVQLTEFAKEVGITPGSLRTMLSHTPDHLRPRRPFPNSPAPYYYRKSDLEAWLSTYLATSKKEKKS